MPVNGEVERPESSEPPWRPLWWWFVIHGVIVAAWGVFALVSPVSGVSGWLLDGTAYGIMLVLAGSQLVAQGLTWRRHGPGWIGMLLAGVVALCAAILCITAGALGNADALFWIVIAFFAVEGAVFIAGTYGVPAYRYWGILMGGIVYLALIVMVVLRLTIDVDFDVVDPVWAALALLYGIAMISASLQVRHDTIADRGRMAGSDG